MVVDEGQNEAFIKEKAEEIRNLLDVIHVSSKLIRNSSALYSSRTFRPAKVCEDFQSKPQRKEVNKQWNGILDKMNEAKLEDKRLILQYEFERHVTVKKDIPPPPAEIGECHVHRKYKAKDTVLDIFLRRTPPTRVLSQLAELLPTYNASQTLFRIVKDTTLADDHWDEFIAEFNKLKKDKSVGGYGLNIDQVHQVFLIRHSRREDTILHLCARRNPPLRVIESILDDCRDSMCVVDCSTWDWIPMQYAIRHHASPEVVRALIPTRQDHFISTGQTNYHFCCSANDDFESGIRYDLSVSIDDTCDLLFKPDYHYRTPLHWAAYYDNPLETIQALKNACSEEVLFIKDHCGHEPYKTAIWHGRSTSIIEAFFVTNSSLPYNKFEDVLAKLIRSLVCHKEKSIEGSEETLTQHGTYEYEHFDLPSISAEIANSPALQKIIGVKSCAPLPTVVVLADFFSCIFLIASYHMTTRYYLAGKDVNSSAWFGILVVTISYIALREIAQILVEHVRWFTSEWNYLDIAIITSVVTSMIQMWMGESEKGESSYTLIVVTTALVWLNAIFFLRSTFMAFATFVGGIFKIITDLVPFIVVSSLILMMFGEMYAANVLAEKGECRVEDYANFDFTTDFCSFRDSIFITYGLFVEGIDMNFYATRDVRMKIISMIFGFLVAIILLNVVIVIVGNSWNEVAKYSKEVFWAYRLGFLVEVKGYEMLPIFANQSQPRQSKLDKILFMLDCRMSDLCKIFWPSKRYWGNFDSIFDRIFSDSVGSLRWQCLYESRKAWYQIILMLMKVAIMLLIFGAISAVWFIVGLVSFGLLWPYPIRRFILASSVEKDVPASKQDSILQARSPSSVNPKTRSFFASTVTRPSSALSEGTSTSTTENSILRANIRARINELERLHDSIPDDQNPVQNSNVYDDISYVTATTANRGGRFG